MSARTDLTRWNRAGLRRFTYVDGNAATLLEMVRDGLARRFGGADPTWDIVHAVPQIEDLRERLQRIEAQYGAERRDMGWEIVRLFARGCHILTGHVDAYANEGFLGTATQWDNVRRLVEMLDYHPAPPASASTAFAIVAKPGALGLVAKGFQTKYSPKTGSAVVFETLEDVTVDAKLNELRPAEHDRDPTRLTGDVLMFDGAVKHLKTGEPIVLEEERSGALRAYLIQGILEEAARTRVTVRPPLWHEFVAGYTIVHAQPADRLDPRGPAAVEATIGRVLHLAEPPGDLHAGEMVYVSDPTRRYYRRVVAVNGRIVAFSEDLGPLNLLHGTLARPQLVSVNRLPGREPFGNEVLRVIRVAGDYSRLLGATIADLCIANKQTRIETYEVMGADYVPGEQKDNPNAGYTILKALIRKDARCVLANPQSLWVPPVGGAWRVDAYIEKQNGHLPTVLVTSKPKQAAAGDFAVVTRGNQMAWTRLGSVETDLAAGEAVLKANGVWNDRGGADFFLADTSVYAHFKQHLRVSGWGNNRTPLTSNSVPLSNIPPTLKRGAKLLLENAGSESALATITVIGESGITLSRPVPAGSTRSTLILRGNVVTAGHGESKGEKVLGSGAASQSNQVFLLKVAEVSFIADSTQTTGVRADVVLRVGEREWTQVSTLNDSGPADPHYVVRMTEDGYVLIGFGDGTNGRRLPTGPNNVRVSYRKGTGLAGNLPAGSLTKPAKPHALVEAVRQLTPAVGGNDMEGTASLRENAPASLLTLERAVSLEDFGALAASHSSVWQARAFFRPRGFEQQKQTLIQREHVEVIVVPANGGPLGDLEETLRQFVLAHAVPGVALNVIPYIERTFDVDVEITVNETEYVADDVRLAVENALRREFALIRRRLGQDVFLSEIYKVVEGITGVEHSTSVVDSDPLLRRVLTDDHSVRVLGDCVVRVHREIGAAPPPGDGAGGEAPSQPAPLQRPVAQRSSIVVDGVGDLYGTRLAAVGAATVRTLAALDPDATQIDMPRPKVWEAVSKAQLLLEFEVDVAIAGAVLDRPLFEIASMTPSALAAIARVSVSRAMQLRASIRRLQVALDEQAFRTLTLREFIAR